MKYSTQHKYQCSEAYKKWKKLPLREQKKIDISLTKSAYKDAYRTCIEGFDEWISVDTDLPPSQLPVLTIKENGKMCVDFIHTLLPTPVFWRTRPDNPVTHWKKIEPPTGTKTPEE